MANAGQIDSELPSEMMRILEENTRQAEDFWRKKYDFLASKGHILHRKLQPEPRTPAHLYPVNCGPVAGWHVQYPGDSVSVWSSESPGVLLIRRIETGSAELDLLISYGDVNSSIYDVTSHCVPIQEYFDDPTDLSVTYLVTPFVCEFYVPSFENVGDVVDFTQQVLEGLVFFHQRGIAFNDLLTDVKMDAQVLYPEGFHTIYMGEASDGGDFSTRIPRMEAKTLVKYYFNRLDGITHVPVTKADGYPTEESETRRKENREYTLAREFKRNLYALGYRLNYYRSLYSSISCLTPLIDDLLFDTPDAKTALEQVTAIRADLTRTDYRWPLRSRYDCLASLIADAYTYIKSVTFGL